jgi:hypothetical protein
VRFPAYRPPMTALGLGCVKTPKHFSSRTFVFASRISTQ